MCAYFFRWSKNCVKGGLPVAHVGILWLLGTINLHSSKLKWQRNSSFYLFLSINQNTFLIGNYIGGEMYKQGKACTKCPSGTSCSASYPGLCGKYSKINFPQGVIQ